jgi:hypothetical protein
MAKHSSRKRFPIIGEAFDAHQMNDAGRLNSYAIELEHYRPRGFSALARSMRAMSDRFDADNARADDAELMDSMIDDAESLLTEWARRVARHDYIWFGPFADSGSVGFNVDTESAREDADIVLDAGESVPRGFSGLAFFVNDHGNACAQTYSRGRMCRELFDVV